MTHYEKMARRVVKDGLTAMALDMDEVLTDEVIGEIVTGFTDAIMLGLKELLKPDELTSNMG